MPEQLAEDLRVTLKAISRIEPTVKTLANQQSNNTALLQELHNLQSLPAEIEQVKQAQLALVADLQDLESLPEILRHQEQQLQNQEQALKAQTQSNEATQEELRQLREELRRIKQALPGALNHPVKVILNGRELTLKTVLMSFFLALALVVGSGGLMLWKLSPALLNRLEILNRINGRVNNLELNQRKLLEEFNLN